MIIRLSRFANSPHEVGFTTKPRKSIHDNSRTYQLPRFYFQGSIFHIFLSLGEHRPEARNLSPVLYNRAETILMEGIL